MNGKEFFKNEENIRYIKTVSKNMFINSVLVYYMELEDYTQEQIFNMYRKIRFYNEDRSKLNTFMIMCIKNKHNEIYQNMVRNKRKLNNPLHLQYLDNTNTCDIDNYNYIHSKEDDNTLEFILEDYKNILNEEEIGIIRYKYYGLTGREIGVLMGTNVKHVEYKIRVIRKKIKNVSAELN